MIDLVIIVVIISIQGLLTHNKHLCQRIVGDIEGFLKFLKIYPQIWKHQCELIAVMVSEICCWERIVRDK